MKINHGEIREYKNQQNQGNTCQRKNKKWHFKQNNLPQKSVKDENTAKKTHKSTEKSEHIKTLP